MGIAVSENQTSDEIVIFLSGGGACWDAASCFVLNSASHIQGISPAGIVAEAMALESWLFDRTNWPFAEASYVYVPYCTGDLHVGTRTTTYQVLFDQKTVHHQGARNMDAILASLAEQFPNPSRIRLVGYSASGCGATLNWWRVRRDFPGVPVDVTNDSGLVIDPAASRWAEFVKAWQPELDPSCDGCANGFGAVLPHYAETVPAENQLVVAGYLEDAVISLYFALQTYQVKSRMEAMVASLPEDNPWGFLLLPGLDHVVLEKWATYGQAVVDLL